MIGISLLLFGALHASAGSIESRIRPDIWKRVLENREVHAYAQLHAPDQEKIQNYELYAVMLVQAPVKRVKEVLLDYPLYQKLIPFVQSAKWDTRAQLLELQGGVWKFHLKSWIQFKEEGDEKLLFKITRGHFTGLKGEARFEAKGPRQTVVYFFGNVKGKEFPPAFVIERGAEMVFSFTGRKMRAYMEEIPQGNERKVDDQAPRPRRGFRKDG